MCVWVWVCVCFHLFILHFIEVMVSMCELFCKFLKFGSIFFIENANIINLSIFEFPFVQHWKINQVNKWDMRMAFVLITGHVLTYYTIHNSVGYLKRLQNCTTILYILFTRIYLLHYIIQTRFSFVYPFAFAFAFLFIILFLCLVFSMSFTFACFALVYVIGCIYLM